MSNAQLGRLLSAALCFSVSLVSLLMAAKGLSAREWLPFHQASAAADWDSLPPRVQRVLLFLVRATALGFLTVGLLLVGVPVYLVWHPDPVVSLEVIGVGVVYCGALGILTRWLHRETGARTPWRESFGAAGSLLLAAVLTLARGRRHRRS